MTETSRRELLRWLLGAPLAQVACRKSPPISSTHIESREAFKDKERGHQLRSGRPPSPTSFTKSDVLIVGAGVAGLSAAWRLKKSGVQSFKVLDIGDSVGGTSRFGEDAISKHPWGAHYVTVPDSKNKALIGLLQDVGAVEGLSDAGEPMCAEHMLCRDPEERLFYKGRWYEGLYLSVGASVDDLRERERFESIIDGFADAIKPAFTLPISKAVGTDETRALDSITASQWIKEQGFSSERLLWWLDYSCRDDFGSRPTHVSAWAMIHYFASRKRRGRYANVLTWPEGNGRLVTELAKGLGDQVISQSVAFNVDDSGGPGQDIKVSYLRDGKPFGVQAKKVVVCTPQFVTKRLVASIRREPNVSRAMFEYSPWLVANLTLSERPSYLGFETAWDNVLYHSPSLGYVVSTHQRGPERGPTHWTYYYPLTGSDLRAERTRLESLSRHEWIEVVLSDLEVAHPKLRSMVKRVDFARYGHAMIRPKPGLRSMLAEAKTSIGGVHFAHSDLSGVPLFEEAFDQGIRAAEDVLGALGHRVVSIR